jgi:TonB-like protein
MMHSIPMRLRNGSVTLCLMAALFSPTVLKAQTGIPGLRQIRWPLLDIVILPDSSSGLLFLVAPNPRAVQWTKPGTSVVSMGIDPITALQWATVAHTLLADPSSGGAGAWSVAPPLRGSRGPEFVLLAKNPKRSAPSEALIFLVSDSALHTQWKTFVSPAQLDALLTGLEAVARERQATWDPSSTAFGTTNDSVEVPVRVVFQPEPKFPGKLAFNGREGRVWMSYAVDSTGRTETGSMRPLLSDDLLFTQAAIDALMHSKFKPALRHGRPVRQQVFQVIQFRQW